MPDQNNPFDNQNPAPDASGVVSNPPADTPTMPTPTPEKPEETDNKPLPFPEDTSIPPISPDMVKDSPTFTPSQTISDSAPLPNPDGLTGVPPMVPGLTPKKKIGGKKMIATILGILVLLGSLGAGIFLVKQQQDIRERAVYPTPIPEAKCSKDSVLTCIGKDPGDECGPNKLCKKKESFGSDGKPICGCISQSTPTPTPTLTPLVKCSSGSAPKCVNKKPGDICDGTTKCTPITTPGPDNTVKCICEEEPPQCKECEGLICVSRTCTGASLCQTNNDCQPMSGQCVGVKAYDKNWNPIVPHNEALNLKAGDIIYFAVQGSGGPGIYDKAQFKFKGIQMPVIIDKKPGIGFYKQYQITSDDIGKDVTVKGRIHNSVMGWSETTGWTEDWPED